ncbi:reverse transcriptase [Tanacetum coccineum]
MGPRPNQANNTLRGKVQFRTGRRGGSKPDVTNLPRTSRRPRKRISIRITRLQAGPYPNKDSKAAYGIVVRDSVGTLVRVSGKSCFATSPLHDEVIAINYACYLAYNQGWCDAIVESDSQTAISLSSLEAVPPWSLGVLIDDIRTWSKSLHLTFSWVNRVNNQVAHWTAQFALSLNQCIMCDVSIPYELTSLARSDLYGS